MCSVCVVFFDVVVLGLLFQRDREGEERGSTDVCRW